MGKWVKARRLFCEIKFIACKLAPLASLHKTFAHLRLQVHKSLPIGREREIHEQHRASCEALRDREGVARACGNLGCCYESTGDYGRARELHEQRRAMAEALGDRAGVAKASGSLARCCVNTGEYARAISHFSAQYDMAKELQVVICQADAALGMGVALRLLVRASVRGRAAGAFESPGSHLSTSACGDDRVQEAGRWLEIAVDLGHAVARLHLACLAFDAGDEQTALAHLQDYLSSCVGVARNQCEGCNQTRGEDAHMLTCAGCRVARFCSLEHQKMASRDVSRGGSLLYVRHKHVCGLLGTWRQRVVKDGAPPDALRAELLSFLRQ